MKKILFLVLLFLIILGIGYKSDIPKEVLIKKYAKNSTSKFIEIDGMNVHYKIEGKENNSIPLVLIHGTSSSLFTWDSCVKDWSKTNKIIRLDLPGFALTGPNKENNYSFEYYTKFIYKFLLKLNVKKCNLAGNSLGGGIALFYALEYPNKVNKLILIDSDGYSFSSKTKSTIGFIAIKTLGKIPIINEFLNVITPEFMVKKSVEDVYYDKSKITQKTYEMYNDFLLREGNRKALVKKFAATRIDKSKEIKNISMPTLIIWGGKDQSIPIECAYKFKKNIRNSELVIIKNSGHIPMEESPKEIISIINNFIK